MMNSETAAAPELPALPLTPPPLPPLPGDVNDALRKAYNTAKNTVELRPVIDQTILNAARENARQSIPFYKKIPWYTQFSMAGAVFGSLFLSAVVLHKTVVHKYDKGVEELVMAELATKNEDARKKAPMVVSILPENSNASVALAPAEPAAKVVTAAAEPSKPMILAAAPPALETRAEVASNITLSEQRTTIIDSLTPIAKSEKADTKTAGRVQDKIVMADATALAKDSSRSRKQASEAAEQAGNTMVGSATKAKETNIVVAQLTPPPPAATAPVVARALAPQIAAAPVAPTAPAAIAAPAAASVPVETAQAWLSRVETLQRGGKTAQAKTELQALLKRYPDTVLTTELKRLLSN